MKEEYSPQFDFDNIPEQEHVVKTCKQCGKSGEYLGLYDGGICFECKQKNKRNTKAHMKEEYTPQFDCEKATDTVSDIAQVRDFTLEERLEQQLMKMADEVGRKKWMRIKRTFFVLTVVFYFVFLGLVLKDFEMSVKNLFYLIVTPILCATYAASLVMFISYAVLFYIINNTLKEEKAIAKKLGEYEAVKYHTYEYSVKNTK